MEEQIRPPDKLIAQAGDVSESQLVVDVRDDAASIEVEGSSSPLCIQQLIADHHQAVFRYAYRLSGDHEDAEDLSQQTFLIAHEKLHQLREPEKVRGWLYQVLRSVYLKSQRHPRPMTAASAKIDVNDIPQFAANEDNIDRERLQAAVDELPDEYKIVVVMFYFERISYKEIAEQLDLPIGTVMSRLSRAKSRLRGRLLAAEVNVS